MNFEEKYKVIQKHDRQMSVMMTDNDRQYDRQMSGKLSGRALVFIGKVVVFAVESCEFVIANVGVRMSGCLYFSMLLEDSLRLRSVSPGAAL